MSDTQTKVLTNEVMKGILSDTPVFRGRVIDGNTIRTPGLYFMHPSTITNPPELTGKYGTLMVLKSEELLVDIAFIWGVGLEILYRMRSNTVIQEFRKISTTATS